MREMVFSKGEILVNLELVFGWVILKQFYGKGIFL